MAYCSVIVKNLYLNRGRKQRVETTSMATDPPIQDELSLEHIVEKKQACEQVMRLIGSLPELQRQVITLHDVEGWSKEEVREKTGLGATHIRVLLSRARKTIRQLFKN